MQQHITHSIPISAQRFWKDLFFSPEYTKQVHLEGLSCSAYDIITPCSGAPHYRRSFFNVPPLNIPASLQKMVGSTIGYTEQGYFDPKTQRYHFTITPNVLNKRLKIEGYYFIETIDEHSVNRSCILNTTVNVFGVGKKIEAIIAQSNIDIQAKTAEFAKRWIAQNL